MENADIKREVFREAVRRIVEYVDDFVKNETNKSSEFSQGRALAYKEVVDVIQNSLQSNNMNLDEYGVDFDTDEIL